MVAQGIDGAQAGNHHSALLHMLSLIYYVLYDMQPSTRSTVPDT